MAIIGSIILALLILTPIFNISEVVSILSGNMEAFAGAGTPIYIKLIKDIGFLAIIAFSFLMALKNGRLRRLAILLVPMAAMVLAVFFISYKKDPLQAMAGLRWALPFIAAVLLTGNVEERLIFKIAKVLCAVFLVHVTLQLYEHMITSMLIKTYNPIPMEFKPAGQHYFFERLGKNLFGLRSPGIFMQPNTAGLFAIVSGFFAYFYLKRSVFRATALALLPLSILLCGSATAMFTYILAALCIFLLNKNTGSVSVKISVLLITVAILAAIGFNLRAVTGRVRIMYSAKERVDIFSNKLQHGELISTRFGKGTNSAALVTTKILKKDLPPILESTVSEIISNIGLIGFFAFAAGYLYWLVRTLRSGRADCIVFTLIYSIFFIASPVTESFPMNLLFAVGLAYFAPRILPRNKET